jgi:hypothetical protein
MQWIEDEQLLVASRCIQLHPPNLPRACWILSNPVGFATFPVVRSQVLALMAAALVQAEGASGIIMEELLRAQLEARAGAIQMPKSLVESLVGLFGDPKPVKPVKPMKPGLGVRGKRPINSTPSSSNCNKD